MALRFEAQNERRLLAAGATLTLLGIALSAAEDRDLFSTGATWELS